MTVFFAPQIRIFRTQNFKAKSPFPDAWVTTKGCTRSFWFSITLRKQYLKQNLLEYSHESLMIRQYCLCVTKILWDCQCISNAGGCVSPTFFWSTLTLCLCHFSDAYVHVVSEATSLQRIEMLQYTFISNITR